MQEHGFSLTRILPYKDRIIDSVQKQLEGTTGGFIEKSYS